MDLLNHLYRVGFIKDDFQEISSSKFSFEQNELKNLQSNQILLYNSIEAQQNKTVFYFFNVSNLTSQEQRELHLRIWNEDKSDFYIFKDNNCYYIVYSRTSPNDKNRVLYKIPENKADSYLLEKIKKTNLQNGMFWFELKDKLDKINKQKLTIDKELIANLKYLKQEILVIFKKNNLDTAKSEENTQALIDRTLFIKYLEDKNIVNSWYHNDYENYKSILVNHKTEKLNELFLRINHIFNNSLFSNPYIEKDFLCKEVLQKIYYQLIGGNQSGQLRLFDFRFDIIPPETISQIYEVFLEKDQQAKGIYYTPTGLARLIVEKTITGIGKILDPSCGSGSFLITAFDYIIEKYAEKKDTIKEQLEYYNKLLFDNIKGIELKDTARRLTIFSLSLKLLSKFDSDKLKNYISENINKNKDFRLFEKDFSKNILCANSLDVNNKDIDFDDEKFDFIVGNPPWKQDAEKDSPEYKYWETNKKEAFEGKIQLSELFLHKIKYWSKPETRFGFVVNSSSFQGENLFQDFFYKTYRIERIYEFTKLKDYLFHSATEPAIVLVFDNKPIDHNIIRFVAPNLTNFSKTFKLTVFAPNDIIDLPQIELINKTKTIKQYISANDFDLKLIEKLQNPDEFNVLENYLLRDENQKGFLRQGIITWGETALKKVYNIYKKDITKREYDTYNDDFHKKYCKKNKENNYVLLLKNSNLQGFKIVYDKKDEFWFNDLSIYHRGREKEIFEGERIICTRVGSKLNAWFTDEFYLFYHQLFALKLTDNSNYYLFTAILNSKLIEFFVIKDIKTRITGNLPTLNDEDLIKIPIPKHLDSKTVEKINQISKNLTDGITEYKDVETELNTLICKLYGLSYYERQRIFDFSINENDIINDKKELNKYISTFSDIVKGFLPGNTEVICDEDDIYISETKEFGLIIIKFNFIETGEKPYNNPTAKHTGRYLLNEILGNAAEHNILKIRDRIYTKDAIYIVKEKGKRNWTETKAFEDGQIEIQKGLN